MKVVSFGEIMLRLSPDGYYKLFQKPELNTSFCGAEANVAVALSNFGDEAEFVTALPDNDIGRAACRELMRYGVKTDNIVCRKRRKSASLKGDIRQKEQCDSIG